MTTEIMKRNSFAFVFGIVLVLLSGCGASFQVAGDVAQGRQALLKGDYQAALGYFQAGAQVDPQYVFGAELREGVLSYLGRAQYLVGQLPQAEDTLRKDIAQHRSDNVATLYLGLTLARRGDNKGGLQYIEAGMKGIRDFLNYLATSFSFGIGQFWDPNRDIRNAIERDLAMISGKKIDWPTLLGNGERLGMRIEGESDLALQREADQSQMDRMR